MRGLLKRVIGIYVDIFARLRGYSFPPKYNWKWKLDVLFMRYEPETTRLIKRELKPGMTFIDIGAHIGYSSRLAAKKVGASGRVISFEADTQNAALLEKNVVSYPNVTIVKKAIGASEGVATFYHVQGSTGCHSLIASSAQSASYEVPTTSLDAYVEKNGDTINMIKMDIEGGEWNGLLGMQKVLQTPSIRLIIEYNPDALSHAGINPHDLLRHLFDEGFSIFIILKNHIQLSRAHVDLIDKYLEAGSVNIYCTKP